MGGLSKSDCHKSRLKRLITNCIIFVIQLAQPFLRGFAEDGNAAALQPPFILGQSDNFDEYSCN